MTAHHQSTLMWLTLLASLCFATTAYAERLMPIDFTGQPVMLLSEGEIESCGLRVLGVQAPNNFKNTNELLWIPDGSFMFNRKGYGLVKAIAQKSTLGNFMQNKKPTDVQIKSFWYKAEGVKATSPMGNKIIQGEQPTSKLYGTDADSVLNVINASLAGKNIQFALKFADGDDIAFYGKVSLKEEEAEQVRSCLAELVDLMEKDVAAPSKVNDSSQ